MNVAIELKGIPEALQILERVAKDGQQATKRALTDIAVLVHKEAVANAPRSPKRKELNRFRKTKRKVNRNKRGTSRPTSGGLRRSIKFEVTNSDAKIFVPSNSEAGKYAAYIHDQKNQPGGWRNRGIGTIIEGARADEKFILRAIVDNEGNIMNIIKSEHKKAGWYEL